MKIAIALSGGVDSAVAGALLKQSGHELVGVTALVWPDSRCCDARALHDAELVATALKIPYFTVDVMKEFKDQVVDPFINDYCSGRTPNPCPLCNTSIRFGTMWDKILEQHPDCQAVATGHYAIIEQEQGQWRLRKGSDDNKDQSYMLYGLSQEQLGRTLTPLGAYTKEQSRKMAEAFGLFVSNKPDSQDACFVSGDYKKFLREQSVSTEKQNTGFKPGKFVDSQGQVLGEHDGIANYTIGQRKGLNVQRKGDDNDPIYVIGIDAKNNQVVLGDKDECFRKEFECSRLNWLIPEPKSPVNIAVRIRYNSSEVAAMVTPLADGRAQIVLAEPQSAVTPGQAAVFFDGDVVVGGGIID
ncbi:MAG: tRNA 2-thiouridine(34) synthase MnmA [Candidatus Margulisiibacteriota bacterium]|jgi:tRNA-specific 2-thiouridylase